jgi:histidinol-phosphate phosphatase family protein
LGDGARFGVQLRHVREETPLGTAGGVAALRDELRGDFYVLYGDVIVNMDLARLLDFHRSAKADATLVVHPNDHPHDSDLLELDREGRVSALHPKPRPADGPDLPNLVSAALYVLSDRSFEHIETGRSQDFVQDVFPRMQAGGRRLFGYRTTEYLKDMGTPERLARVARDVESGKLDALHRDRPRPAVFFDRDGVVNVERDGVYTADDLELEHGAAAAIRRFNQAGWLVGVVTNQPGIAKGFFSESDLEAIHRRLERRLGDAGAWLDGLAFCPHHPERGFPGERPELKQPCTCRKPEPGLLQELETGWTVNRDASVLVGDSWRDMAAAHAFGVDAIGVLSGHELRATAPAEHAVTGRPDVVVDDVDQAAGLVLDSDPGINALAERVRKGLESDPQRPAVVLLGGLARTGKSTSAFRLRRRLRRSGIETLWILRDRFQLALVNEALDQLSRGDTVEAPGYDPRTRGGLGSPVRYDPAGADVLLVEGVPALLLDTPATLRVQVELADEAERQARLERYYAHKGLSAEATRHILAGRGEEIDAVRAAAVRADLTLEPLPHPRQEVTA